MRLVGGSRQDRDLGYETMKKILLVVLVFLVGISIIFPCLSHAWGRRHYHGGHYGWYGPGVFLGGLLLGAAISRPWYPPPPPVYAYPAPTVVYAYPPPPVYLNPPSPGVYARPDTSGQHTDNPPGEWVTVPGQWVEGTWVPPHKAWVPVNP